MKSSCVFCDRTKLEERIIFENKNFYVVATLGQITDGGYTLLIPKNHISCMGMFAYRQTQAMLELGFEICKALSLEYCHSDISTPYPITIFEHGIVGQTIGHAHLHFLPTAIDLTPNICRDFPAAEMEKLQHDVMDLQSLYKKRPKPYLFWTVPREKSMVCWNPPAPREYLRIIAAELLGRPERGSWRNMDPELDKKLWTETVRRLKPYFL